MNKEKCLCDVDKINNFKKELEKMHKIESDKRSAAKAKFKNIEDEFDRKIKIISSKLEDNFSLNGLKERASLIREKRKVFNEMLRKAGLDFPPFSDRLYPKGSKIHDSFGFRIQFPGECNFCFDTYKKKYDETINLE